MTYDKPNPPFQWQLSTMLLLTAVLSLTLGIVRWLGAVGAVATFDFFLWYVFLAWLTGMPRVLGCRIPNVRGSTWWDVVLVFLVIVLVQLILLGFVLGPTLR